MFRVQGVWECVGFVSVQGLGVGHVHGSGFRLLVGFQGSGLRSVFGVGFGVYVEPRA